MAGLLKDLNFEEALARIGQEPPGRMVKALFSCLCSCDEQIKWYAVSGMGQVVADLARDDMENARVVMRRFMWMLNDESGGIGWGIPEAMAEVMARHQQMAGEYAHMLVAFMREDGFYLELLPLQRGLMWGLGRLAATNQENRNLLLGKDVALYLQPYLRSSDPVVRGLAARAAGFLMDQGLLAGLHGIVDDHCPLTVYDNGKFIAGQVGELARKSLQMIEKQQAM